MALPRRRIGRFQVQTRFLCTPFPLCPALAALLRGVAPSPWPSEFGLGVAVRKPRAESMNDKQTDDEQANSHEYLEAALLCLEADLTRSSKEEHEGERVEGVHEPVGLGLHQGQDERDGSHRRQDPGRRIGDRHRYRSGNPERGSDRLPRPPMYQAATEPRAD
jgi:hypothetical protein